MSRRSPGWVLALALLGISFAGPLVKLSAADPLAIAVWRLGFSLVIVAGFLLATGEWRQLIGIALAIVGAAVIAIPNFIASGSPAANASVGNLLAASAAVTAAIYY